MKTSISWLTDGLTQPSWQHHLDRPALSVEDGDTWTYRELHERSLCLAQGLVDQGVKPGDRVALLMYNALDYWAVYLAVTRIRAIAVRVNFRLSAGELSYILADSGASVVCFHDSFEETIEQVRDGLATETWVSFPYEADARASWAIAHTELDVEPRDEVISSLATSDDPAMLMYTSGTTGRPKGAVWTHGNTMWFAAMQVAFWSYDESTVALTTGPLYHVGAFEDLLLPALFARGHAVITRSGGFSVERVMSVIDTRKVTDTLLYPFMIYDVLRHPRLGEFDLTTLRRIVTGGSPITAWAISALGERLPNTDLVPTYGLTEGGAISTGMPSKSIAEYPDAVGRPLPMTELRIVGPLGDDVPSGESGEIWVRSPAVAREYWGNREATAETFIDGWCRTGDLGRYNEAGLVVVTGRDKDMIKSGGENVYPVEIERVLALHPAIEDAAVIGIADPRYQEVVCAVVVLKRGEVLTEQQVIDHCREHLASYKKPRQVVIVPELPRTASGKIKKFVLRDEYKDLGSGQVLEGTSP